jgi:hypothetical protein
MWYFAANPFYAEQRLVRERGVAINRDLFLWTGESISAFRSRIHQTRERARTIFRRSRKQSPERITYEGTTLEILIQGAYGVQADQISGPGWLRTEWYTLAAKLPPGTTLERASNDGKPPRRAIRARGSPCFKGSIGLQPYSNARWPETRISRGVYGTICAVF